MSDSGEHHPPNRANAGTPHQSASPDSLSDIVELFAPAHSPSELGRVGDYRVLKLLGIGGMGRVYLAEDTRHQRAVALKFLLPALALDETSARRFLREGRAAAQVRHENVVAIYEVGELQGLPFIAMEYLRGTTLQDFMKNKGRPSRRHSVRICKEVLSGLHAAHELGLVHRDIKPANIWLEPPKGNVRLIDFGLAMHSEADTRLTSTGMVVGTPRYMSPEQAQAQTVDARSDLFSIGVVLYELTTGHLPFDGANPIATLMSVAWDDPPPVRHWNPQVPTALEALIVRLMAKNPKDRPQTALAAIEELEGALSVPSAPVLPAIHPAPDASPHRPPPSRDTGKPPPKHSPPTHAKKPRPVAVKPTPHVLELDDDEPLPRRHRRRNGGRNNWLILGGALIAAVLLLLAIVAIVGMLG